MSLLLECTASTIAASLSRRVFSAPLSLQRTLFSRDPDRLLTAADGMPAGPAGPQSQPEQQRLGAVFGLFVFDTMLLQVIRAGYFTTIYIFKIFDLFR